MRDTNVRAALRSRQRGLLLNPFRFGSGAGSAIQHISSTGGSGTSIVIPAHNAGDLLILSTFRSNSTSPAGNPTDWTSIAAHTDTGGGRRTSVILDSGNSVVSFTLANVAAWCLGIYRGCSGWGAFAQNTIANSTSHTFPAITLNVGDGSSWWVRGISDTNNVTYSGVDGFQRFTNAAFKRYDSNGGVASVASDAVTSSSNSGSAMFTLELLA